MKMKRFLCFFTCLLAATFIGNVYPYIVAAEEIVPPGANISILGYQEVQSVQNGEIITKALKLVLENQGETTLNEVFAIASPVNEEVRIVEGEVFVGQLAAGQTVTTSGEVTISVDASEGQSSFDILWAISYRDANGNPYAVKSLISANLNN